MAAGKTAPVDILRGIAADKLVEVRRGRGFLPLSALDKLADRQLPPRDFVGALRADAGLQRAGLSDIGAATVADSKKITLAVLDGEKGAARDIVILNAAAGLIVADIAKDFPEGAAKAAQAIDNGGAKKKMQAFIAACK